MNYIRPSVISDVKAIADNARPADVQECELWGTTPEEALSLGFRESVQPLTIVSGDTPVGMLGVVAYAESPLALIWLIGANGLADCSIDFIRQSRMWLDHLNAYPKARGFPAVCNWVDLRNSLHVRWLEWLGFEKVATEHHEGVDIAYYKRSI